MARALIVIPARLEATRLPSKPLADIHGTPMIVHVWRRAVAAEAGRVVVATDSELVLAAIRAAGGEAVLTRADHVSGSDRVFEAITKVDPDGDWDIVVNLQGDMPLFDPALVQACVDPLGEPVTPRVRGPDIATLAAVIRRPEERDNPNVVKVIGTALPHSSRLRALYFTRATAPWGEGPLYHHIGIYAYRRAALERFISAPPSPLETRERLEQLRAIEAGMRIDVVIVETVPLGVDTADDLDRARALMAPAVERGRGETKDRAGGGKAKGKATSRAKGPPKA